MTWSDFKQEIWRNASPRDKAILTFWTLWFRASEWFQRTTGWCRHEALTGPVGSSSYTCLVCGKPVEVNDEDEDEEL